MSAQGVNRLSLTFSVDHFGSTAVAFHFRFEHGVTIPKSDLVRGIATPIG